MMGEFMKKTCEHCPYRKDVEPFLTPERGEELANIASNPYNSFTCHKTLGHDDDGDGDTIVIETSKECAGFLTLQHNENGETPYDDDGFEPSANVYDSAFDMEQAYEKED